MFSWIDTAVAIALQRDYPCYPIETLTMQATFENGLVKIQTPLGCLVARPWIALTERTKV